MKYAGFQVGYIAWGKNYHTYGPMREKTCLWGVQITNMQTSLLIRAV